MGWKTEKGKKHFREGGAGRIRRGEGAGGKPRTLLISKRKGLFEVGMCWQRWQHMRQEATVMKFGSLTSFEE